MAGPLERQILSLQNDPNLAPFIMKEAKPTGRTLGSGSYGSVEEIKVDELVCAGKVIHAILLGGEAEDIAQKYVQECQLMASLRHPNVTQFLGLCFLPPAKLPVLLMEKLEESLDDLLETVPNIPMALKRSILEDVARGLLYLHRRDPPIIHRDLTAKNVLLTSSFTAKITDLGNSRIVPHPEKLKLTQVPGATMYMPPEALNMDPHYGPSLDIFSFGHLGLFVGLQVFPDDLLPYNYRDPELQRLVGRTELERRELYLNQLENSLPNRDQHPFVRLIKQCLDDTPSERPTTEVLLKDLEDMRIEIEGPYGSYEMAKQDLMRQVTVARTLKSLKQSEDKVEAMKEENRRLQKDLESTKDQISTYQFNMEQLTTKLKLIEEQKHSDGTGEYIERANASGVLETQESPEAQEEAEKQNDSFSDYKEGEHWVKVKFIDEGAYYVLYLGNDLAKGTFFFVKEMLYSRGSASDQELAREGIMDEIDVLSRVRHDNIVRYLGYSDTEDTSAKIYIFLEYKWMTGSNLCGILELIGRPFSESVIANYARQITSGIAYLHDNGIIHKDLNGTNIFVDYSGHSVCISDFGGQPEKLTSALTGHEGYRNMKGRTPFLAPEVIKGSNKDETTDYGRKCDVWSIGCVIILMATGKPPWLDRFDEGKVDSMNLLFTIAMAKEPPALPKFSNPALKEFTVRCLKIDPKERATTSELLNLLQ